MASYTREQIIAMTQGKDGSRGSRADFTATDFTGLDLSNINFLSARFLPRSDFTNANLSGASIRNALMEGEFSTTPANIHYFNLTSTTANKLNAYSARYPMVQTDLNTAKMNQCIVNDSDFHNCIFRNAYLVDSMFYRCDFSFSDFTDAKFENFFTQTATRDTTIKQCNFDDCMFLNTDFLNNVAFEECSFRNTRFIYTRAENFQDLVFTNCNLSSMVLIPFNGSTGNITFDSCNISGSFIPDQSSIMLGNVVVQYEGTTEQDHAFRYMAYFN